MMNLIFVLGNITIILVTLPVFKTIRISAEKRKDEFLKLQTMRQSIIENYNFDESVLKEFVLNEEEMIGFADYFNRTGHIPEWSEFHRLENPDLYEILRFHVYTNTPSLHESRIIGHLRILKNQIFPNSPDVSFQDIRRDYVEGNLNELISVENYLAIRILEKDFRQVELNNLVGWRIKRALYSLAIRQYSEKPAYSQWKLVCDSKFLKSESHIDVPEKAEIELEKLRLCRKKRLFPEKPSASSSVNMNNPSSHWIIYKHIITDSKFVVYLEDVIKRNDEILYFLLPQTRFKVIKGPSFHETVGGKVDYIELKNIRNIETSQWLANAANMIEMYENKEKKYFEKYYEI